MFCFISFSGGNVSSMVLLTVAAQAGAKAGASLGLAEAGKSGAEAGAIAGAEAGQKAGAEAGAKAAAIAATEVATKTLKEALAKLGTMHKPVGVVDRVWHLMRASHLKTADQDDLHSEIVT